MDSTTTETTQQPLTLESLQMNLMAEFNRVHTNYASLDLKVDSICKDIRTLQDGQKTLERRASGLEDSVKTQLENHEKLVKITSDLEATVSDLREEQDRIRRMNNVILFGIPKTKEGLVTAKNVMKVLLPEKEVTIDNSRVGAPNPTNTRPLRIALNNTVEVRTTMRNSSKLKTNRLYDGVYVKKDLTKNQQNERRMVTRSQTHSTGSNKRALELSPTGSQAHASKIQRTSAELNTTSNTSDQMEI